MKKICTVDGCECNARKLGMCGKHYMRFKRYGDTSVVLRSPKGSVYLSGKYLAKRENGDIKHLHVLVAEKVLGKELPKGAVVHHVDGNKFNNASTNLVICPSRGYHMTIHRRQSALEISGDANNRKCHVCHQYDSMDNLSVSGKAVYHKKCAAERMQKRKEKNAIQKQS